MSLRADRLFSMSGIKVIYRVYVEYETMGGDRKKTLVCVTHNRAKANSERNRYAYLGHRTEIDEQPVNER